MFKHLTREPSKHPVVALPRVSQKNWIYIMKYMYTGEVEVRLHSLDEIVSLVEVAETLKSLGVWNRLISKLL